MILRLLPLAASRAVRFASQTVLVTVGAVAAVSALFALGTAGPAAALTTGTDGQPMTLTFVADAGGDRAALLLGFQGDGFFAADDETVRVRIDWGDGTTTDRTSVGFIEHTYSTAGTYTVKIWPLYADAGGSDTGPWLTLYGAGATDDSFYWEDLGNDPVDEVADLARLTTVGSFGNLGITSLRNAFNRHRYLTDVPASLPSSVTDLGYIFKNASAIDDADVGSWDVTGVTDLRGAFEDAVAFDQDLSGWTVSSVTTMRSAFEDATAFDQDLSSWDVSRVTEMKNMFEGASAFNQDVSGWDVSSVTGMDDMFKEASSFNQDVSGWDVSSVTDMDDMFEGASSFNQDVSGWDVSSVTDMSAMFNGASSFNQDLGGWQLNASVDLDRMLDDSGLSVANYDATLVGWAALDPAVTGRSLGANGLQYSADGLPGRCTLVNDRSWTISGDSDGGVDVGDCAAPVAAPRSTGPTLVCSPSSPAVGAEVTCAVSGGDPSIDVLWQATAEGTPIASTGVTLGPDGTGTFRFVAPASALGLPLEVELVGWDRTDDVGVVGGPVPATVPAGDGPSIAGSGRGLILLGILALLAVSLRGWWRSAEMSQSRA